MEYYIGQIFEDQYPTDAADWCNTNGVCIDEIEPIEKDEEETYLEPVMVEQEVLVPATDDEPEHTEIHLVQEMQEKTRTVTTSRRRFQIVEISEPTTDEKKAAVRAVRDGYINGIEWRVSRYRDQVEIGTETTDSNAIYIKILQYMQYLRDYTKTENWWEQEPATYEDWLDAHYPVSE